MNEVIVNYDFKDKIVLVNGIEYVPREILEEVIRDRRRIAMDNAKLIKDMADMQKSMRNAKNEHKKLDEKDLVRMKQEKPKQLERKVYPNWAFSERKEEKSKINREIYEELLKKNTISYSYKTAGLFDLVIEVNYMPYCREYTVHTNKNKLSADEIALIVDSGNLCFGYTGNEISGKIWID